LALLVARNFAIIGLACGLVISAGCKRNKTVNQSQSGTPVSGADGVAGSAAEARASLEKGKELYRNDEDSKAAEAFQEAIKLDPNLAEAHFRLGLSYEALQKAEEAEAAYKKAVDVYKVYLTDNPKDAEAHYNLGQTYAALHLYSDAVREYRQATRLKEDDSDVYCDLGMALTRLAQYDEAAGAFTKSLEIDPENYRAQDGLEEAREGVSRIKAAKKHQEDVLKKQKEDELKKQQEGSSPSPETKTPAER
jgi:tetratricopeptide (TPR) repeat protein